MRALAPLGALTIFAGTAATAAGPHAGGSPGQRIHRLHFKGADTLNWVVHRHATIAALFGVAVIGVWLLRRRRGASERRCSSRSRCSACCWPRRGWWAASSTSSSCRPTWSGCTSTLATVTWLAVLWAVAAAGVLVPRRQPVPATEPQTSVRELEPALADPAG